MPNLRNHKANTRMPRSIKQTSNIFSFYFSDWQSCSEDGAFRLQSQDRQRKTEWIQSSFEERSCALSL